MTIAESLSRIQDDRSPPFSERFYRLLFQRHPDLEKHFVDVDLHSQGAFLMMAMSVVVQHDRSCSRATENYLRVLGQRHFRRGIGRRDYESFRDVVLEVLAEFHQSDWSPELSAEWQTALDGTIDAMLRGHTHEQIID